MKTTVLLTSLLSVGLAHGATTLINATWDDPGDTEVNPTFLQIYNGVGGDTTNNAWHQDTGTVDIGKRVKQSGPAVGAASETTIDFPSLAPTESLVLTVDVKSMANTANINANGFFIGFQHRDNNGSGADLWNNLSPSFGMVVAGNKFLGVRQTAPGGKNGGNAAGQYGGSWGQATTASLEDGFTVTLTASQSGWQIAVAGLEDADGNPITGGSGNWGENGVLDWASFDANMRAGFSCQILDYSDALTPDAVVLNSVNVTQVPETSAALLGVLGLLGLLRRRR